MRLPKWTITSRTSDTLNASWMFDRGPYTQPDPLLNVTSSLFSLREMVGAEETHIFSPTLVNTARIGYNRSHGINGGVVGAINPIADNTSLGEDREFRLPSSAFVWRHDAHGIGRQRFAKPPGLQLLSNSMTTLSGRKGSIRSNSVLRWSAFNSTPRLFSGRMGNSLLTTSACFFRTIPSKVQELEPGNAYEVGSRNTALGFYAQDDWKLKPNLSVTLGLRYEPVTLPTEATNRFAVLTSLAPSVIGNGIADAG